MPAVSQKQDVYMRMVAAGKIKKKGLSRKKAKEFIVSKSVYDHLPAHTGHGAHSK